ncbi:heat shock protein 26-like [Euwallacea fornicatus]|uniref:heat shock protein 26-like n=1 Tax=Euwallacea fornicatus TaxID=995702 RepID=UPI00338F6332
MVTTTLNQQQLSYLFLTLLGGSPSGDLTDKVELKVNGDNFDGSLAVPKWVLAQVAGSVLGYASDNDYSFDNDIMPASIRIDPDWFRIYIDLSEYDQETNKVKVRTLSDDSVKIEGSKKSLNKNGATTTKTVSRNFRVPKTYDVERLTAIISNNGILHISIPKENDNVFLVSRENDKYIRVQH